MTYNKHMDLMTYIEDYHSAIVTILAIGNCENDKIIKAFDYVTFGGKEFTGTAGIWESMMPTVMVKRKPLIGEEINKTSMQYGIRTLVGSDAELTKINCSDKKTIWAVRFHPCFVNKHGTLVASSVLLTVRLADFDLYNVHSQALLNRLIMKAAMQDPTFKITPALVAVAGASEKRKKVQKFEEAMQMQVEGKTYPIERILDSKYASKCK